MVSLFSHYPSSTGLLTIDCRSLVDNWLLLQKRMHCVDPNSECAAVVKANAYGLGVSVISKVLLKEGCRTFFVATLREGVELRNILSGEPRYHLGSIMPYDNDVPNIVVFGGLAHGLGRDWYDYQLTPVLFDVSHLHQWSVYQQSRFRNQGEVINDERSLPCVIKLDTGMHRTGILIEDFEQVCSDELLVSSLSPLLLMSHLACADEPEHPLNNKQLIRFQQLKKLALRHFPDARFSLSNSSALFLGDSYIFDVGRPGIAIYGGNPTPYCANPMNVVVQLSLPVMQTKLIEVGDSIGYGADFTVTRKTRLAIVFGGYADGMLRALSRSGFAYYKGQHIPLLGRVSMDSMVFDITDIKLFDEAIPIDIFGPDQTIDDLAKKANTVGYEILTSLGGRYQRRYTSAEEIL